MVTKRARRFLYLVASLVASLLLTVAGPARATTFQAPVGGKAFPVGEGLIACGASGGWGLEANGLLLRPPSAEDAIGKPVSIRVAPSWPACAQSKTLITAVTVARQPAIDPASITLYLDEGRVELKGKGLRGMRVFWRTAERADSDTCHDPTTDAGVEQCTFAVSRDLPADPSVDALSYLPPGASLGDGFVLFDSNGRAAPATGLPIVPARVLLARSPVADTTLDLTMGRAELNLIRPEAVAGVDCGALDCQLSGKKLVVSSTAAVSAADIKLRLLPHVFLQRRGALETQPAHKLTIVRCAMTFASGPPIKLNPAAKVVLRLESRCFPDPGLARFAIGNSTLRTVGQVDEKDAWFVLLELGAYGQDELEITAFRSDTNAIVGAVRSPTRALPPVRATVELPGYPRIDFIPTNRAAWVQPPPLPGPQKLVLISVPGVYTAGDEAGRTTVIGDPYAEGFTSLVFGLRGTELPEPFRGVDLALVNDSLQRKVQEANVPVPLASSVSTKRPLVEMKCGPPNASVVVRPGDPINLPFPMRETCRVVFHRERLSPAQGRQKLDLSIDVFGADGAQRPEGHVKTTIELRAASDPRETWIQGVTTPFDRVVVRLAHLPDEQHYVRGSEIFATGPAVQWSVILGTGRARIYATSAIPAGLYRFGDADHSGVLSLNFGVISRLTWLTSDGHEGLIGLEGGLMVIGLANSTSTTGRSLTQVGIPVGLGMSVPIANRMNLSEASINLHGWLEFPISGSDRKPAFIFGPSISIGNVGANL